MTDRLKPIQDCLAYTARQYAEVLQARDILAGKLATATHALDRSTHELGKVRAELADSAQQIEDLFAINARSNARWPMTAEQMAARIKDLEAVSDKAYRMLALCFSRIHCLPHTSDTVLAHNIEHLRTEIQTAITRSGTAPSENVKTQDQPRPDILSTEHGK